MKTPRLFVARMMLPLLVAVAVGCLLLSPVTTYALEHPTGQVKELGPYMGDPEEPSSPLPDSHASYSEPDIEYVAPEQLSGAKTRNSRATLLSRLMQFFHAAWLFTGR